MNEFNENQNNTTGEGQSEFTEPQVPQMPQMPQPTVENTEAVTEEKPVETTSEQAQTACQDAPAQGQPVQQPQQRAYNQRPTPPPYRPPYGQPPYGQPYPPQNGNPYASNYNHPQQNPRYPQGQPPYGQQQQSPDYYHMTYGVSKPEKQKMSPGLKALVIIIISVLVACVVGFSVYVAFNSSNDAPQSSTNNGGYFGNYGDFFGDYGEYGTAPTFSQEQSSDRSYDKSNAADEVDPDFEGVKLQTKPKDKDNTEKYNASYSFEKLQEAVVGIICYYEEDVKNDTYQSQGTGIVVTSDGYIVTNSHVIGNSRKAYLIKVVMSDKKEYDAGVVGYDSRSDIAVLKIKANNLTVAQFGNSDETQITEDVIAIGNPSGIEFQNSVTKGIISALDRKVSTSNNVEFLQIDAAINPGNSGGPLCNMYGQVIGITTSKIASEEYEGMGFAIPSATMKTIVDDIIRNSYVTNRVKVGITGVAVYESEAGANGIQIAAITEGGPMDIDDVQVDDIITAVDGEKVTTFAEIFDILEQHKEGDKVKVTLYRPSTGKSFNVKITLQIDKAEN